MINDQLNRFLQNLVRINKNNIIQTYNDFRLVELKDLNQLYNLLQNDKEHKVVIMKIKTENIDNKPPK